MITVIDPKYHELKTSVYAKGQELRDLIQWVSYLEQEDILLELLERLEDPFMFVIVGEVKSGKSSFINALLAPGKEICPVAASPKTDTIQQIIYGEKEREEFLSKYLKRIYLPIPILQDIAIVDTPGTNTIIEHHQEITESFVPISDLIIFVFEAKNPYRQSSWEFFDFISADWRKKVIFILQQKDLVDDQDLQVNLEGVRKMALQKGIADPLVFAVSALMEIKGETDSSGFKDLRQFITTNITGGNAPYLKLEGSIRTIMQINEQLGQGMKVREAQYESDAIFRKEIDLTLDQQEKQTNEQVSLLVENILARYDQTSRKYELMLHNRLSFLSLLKSSFQSIFSKKENLQNWLEQLMQQLDEELKEGMSGKLTEGVRNIAENIQYMAKLVDLKLQENKTILSKNHEIFSDLAEKRSQILRELQDAFAGFLNREENFYDRSMIHKGSSFSPDFVKGSGIAAIGIILTTLTSGVIFDITGGIITTLGIVFTGVSIGLKRKKIEKKYLEEISIARNRLEEQIMHKMQNYVSSIKRKIIMNFFRFDQYLDKERKDIEEIRNRQTGIMESLEELGQRTHESMR